jgi:tRNA A-37 threonylcarbamoyl transferase component Bud32
MLTAGMRIGDWIIVRPLAEGGMGSVFEVHNRKSARIKAALKVIKPHELEAEERFIREAESLYTLRDPAIVRVSGFGEDDELGVIWLAMELVDGENFEHLRARGPMHPDRAAEVFHKIANGLAHAHEEDIFHRDIKPANLMIRSKDNQPVIVDFGIAADASQPKLTKTGMVPGTIAYLPPEIFSGIPPAPDATDIYGLGLVLYELLVGRDAFPLNQSLSGPAQMAMVMTQKVKGASLDPGEGTPDFLRDLVRRATEHEPENRLGSMAEFAAALDRTRSADTPTESAEEPVSQTSWVADVRVPQGQVPAATPEPADEGFVAADNPRTESRETRWVADVRAPQKASVPAATLEPTDEGFEAEAAQRNDEVDRMDEVEANPEPQSPRKLHRLMPIVGVLAVMVVCLAVVGIVVGIVIRHWGLMLFGLGVPDGFKEMTVPLSQLEQAPAEASPEPGPGKQLQTAPEKPPVAAFTDGAAKDAPEAIPISYTLDEEQRTTADELLSRMKNSRFKYSDLKQVNAKIFLALAAESPGDTLRAPATLHAISSTWTHYKKTKDKESVNEDYRMVVRAYLGHPDGATLAQAIKAARYCILDDPPDPETIEKMVAVHENSGAAGKYAILKQLQFYSGWSKNEKVAKLYIDALDNPEPWVVSQALHAWKIGIFNAPDKEQLLKKFEVLLKYSDPGVRGRAAIAIGNGAYSTEEKEWAGPLLMNLLDDKHPFTRSAAASALGRVKYHKALPKLVTLLDDKEKNTYDIGGWEQLDGTSGSVHHDGSPRSRVDDAVLWSMKFMSRNLKPEFEHTKIDYKTKDKDLDRATQEAKDWYKKIKGQIK